MELTTLVDLLEPHIIRLLQSSRVTTSSTGGTVDGGMEQHALFGVYHTGQLDETQASWVDPKIINRIADHSAQADVHHAQLHSILDTTHHFVSGGAALDLFGQTAASTIGRITPEHSPGATSKVLKTDTDGSITLPLMRTNILIGSTDDLTLQAVDDIILSPGSKVYSTVKVGILNSDATYELDVTGTGRFTVDLIVGGNATVSTKVTTPRIEATADLTLAPTGDIYLGPTGGQVRMLPSADLQSDHFQSELNGWRMTYSGELDARYIYAEQLKIKLFIAEMEMALAGSQIVSKSVTTTSRDFLVPYPGHYSYLYVNDLKGAEDMAVFQADDFVRLREYSRSGGSLSTTDGWGTVSAHSNITGKEQRWNWFRAGSCTINGPSQVGAATGTGSSSTTSIALTKVTGTASGHQMYAFLTWTNAAATITPPSSWTLLATDTITGLTVAVYTKQAGGSEPATYTWTFSATTAAIGSLSCWQNVLNAALEIGVKKKTTSATSYDFSDTFMISSSDIVLLFTGATVNANISPPELWTEISDVGTTNLRHQTSTIYGMDNGLQPGGSGVIASSATSITVTVHAIPTYSGLSLTTGYMAPGYTLPSESIALDYGVSGNGWHEISAIDGVYGSNSPYSRIVTWTTHPATGAVVRNQMGHLKGLFGVANEFGFYAGNGTTTNDAFLRLSNTVSAFNNIPITMTQSGVTRIKLDASTGLNLKLAAAADTLTAIRWQDSLGVSTDGAKIDVFNGGSSTQMILNLEAIDAAPIGIMLLRTTNNVGLAEASLSLNSGASISEIFAISNKIYIGQSGVSPAGTSLIELRVNSVGKIHAQGALMVGSSTTTTTFDGTLSVGNVNQNYTPDIGNYATGGSTLLLNALDYSTIAFHDYGARVDYIRGGAGIITLGYDGGYGAAQVLFGGVIGSGWNGFSYGSGWTDYGGGWLAGGWKKVGDLIFLRGLVKRTSGSVADIATLPSGYRPSGSHMVTALTDTGVGRVDIGSGGVMTIVSGGTGWVSLFNVVFSTL